MLFLGLILSEILSPTLVQDKAIPENRLWEEREEFSE